MTAFRILHVNDDPDIREIVALSLGLEPSFSTRNCSSGQEALAVAAEWQPDIILLDVAMPLMDGPTIFLQLQQNPKTIGIPVIFMTARAQTREVERLRSLGCAGVITKPFDAMTLAASLRRYLQPPRDPLDDLRAEFLQRVRRDTEMLCEHRVAMGEASRSPDTLNVIKRLAHSLAGAAGIYGYAEMSDAAATLEDAVIAEIEDGGPCDDTDRAIAGLISTAEISGARGDRAGLALEAAPAHFH